MAALLIPCRVCARHVRAAEPRCPFCRCDSPSPASAAVASPWPARRLGRAALFSLGASLALTGCRTRPLDLPDDAPVTDALTPLDMSEPVDLTVPPPDFTPPMDFSNDGPQPIYSAPPKRHDMK